MNSVETRQESIYSIDPFPEIPAELKQLKQWFEHRNKQPYAGGRIAKWSDPANRRTYQTASLVHLNYAYRHPGERCGVEFLFTEEDPYCGVDLDKCRDPATGKIEDWAMRIIERLPTYAEVSPSGTGVKLFCRGRLPIEKSGGKMTRSDGGAVEMYHNRRLFTMTGQRLAGSPATVNDCQGAIDDLWAEHFPPEPPRERTPCACGHHGEVSADDAEIVRRAAAARNGAVFARLWAGDTSSCRGDHSAADLALCSRLAFWIGPDEDRLDRLFRQSGLCRDKWDRPDYRQATIRKAIDGCGAFYEWDTDKQRHVKRINVGFVQTFTKENSPSESLDIAPQLNSDEEAIDPPEIRCKQPLRGYFRGKAGTDKVNARLFGHHRCGTCSGCRENKRQGMIAHFVNSPDGDSIIDQCPRLSPLFTAEIEAARFSAMQKQIRRHKGEYLRIDCPPQDDKPPMVTIIASVPFANSKPVSVATAAKLITAAFQAVDLNQQTGDSKRYYTSSQRWKKKPKTREFELLGRASESTPNDLQSVENVLKNNGGSAVLSWYAEFGYDTWMTRSTVAADFDDAAVMRELGITPLWMLKRSASPFGIKINSRPPPSKTLVLNPG